MQYTKEKKNASQRDKQEKLGFFFLLILFYLFFEYTRPQFLLNLHIPMMVSILLFIGWLLIPHKKWNPQIICLLLLLGLMSFHVLIAKNTFFAYRTTYGMTALFLFFCIPLIHFVDSFKKVRLFINTMIAIFLYVGIYSIFSGGRWPGGAFDENEVAVGMAMAIPFAYFSLFITKNFTKKILLIGTLGIYAATIVVSFSRGGFLAFLAVIGYIWLKSPKKWVSAGIIIFLAVMFFIVASETYWTEMQTITNTSEATADARLDYWRIAYRMFLANPMLGVGPGNYMANIADYQSLEQLAKIGHYLYNVAHSLFFELLAELGIAGITLFSLILYYNYKDYKFIIRQTNDQQKNLRTVDYQVNPENRITLSRDLESAKNYAHAIAASIFGCLVAGLTLSLLYYSFFWLFTAAMVALKEITAHNVQNDSTLSIK